MTRRSRGPAGQPRTWSRASPARFSRGLNAPQRPLLPSWGRGRAFAQTYRALRQPSARPAAPGEPRGESACSPAQPERRAGAGAGAERERVPRGPHSSEMGQGLRG